MKNKKMMVIGALLVILLGILVVFGQSSAPRETVMTDLIPAEDRQNSK